MENKETADNIILSIVVLTMNRSEQLIEALESCKKCVLPNNTEFIVIDNGSTDDTEYRVSEFMNMNSQLYIRYEKMNTNLGVGGGRSLGFNEAHGKYIYFLDDDAVIDEKCSSTFFMDNIKYLEKNNRVASVTTKIYDELLKYERELETSKKCIDGRKCAFKYLGGSHFLRKSVFDSPLYFNIKYGSEEYAPSIKALEKGYFHVYDDRNKIVHKPKINKWINGSKQNEEILIIGIAVIYATKCILYPKIFKPILYLGYKRRLYKYLKNSNYANAKIKEMVNEVVCNNTDSKIRMITVLKCFFYFGLTVF